MRFRGGEGGEGLKGEVDRKWETNTHMVATILRYG